ncbi:MAG: YIP1 family protein [Candidatus Bathyarchaeota archaeon]|nr:MAG: YIP1 family protein [Candidatus Bathyarchaeota archaeon]
MFNLKPTMRTFLYIAIAWALLVCYSIFLSSVVESVIDLTNIAPPDEDIRQIAIFLYGLAIVSFLGGSQIPGAFLKRRSFVVQFCFSAIFGLMLLLVNILNDTALTSLEVTILKPFFMNYPIVAIEYLSLPYLFMIFIDLHLHERMKAFSWRRFARFLEGILIHPKKTFEEVLLRRSVLYSFTIIIVVSTVFTARTLAFSNTGLIPFRWQFLSFRMYEPLAFIPKISLIIPCMLFLWLGISVLVHVIAHQLDGKGDYSTNASLLGFAFLPSLIVVAIDLIELMIPTGSIVVNAIFFVLDFIIPIIVWPFVLAIFVIRISEKLELRRAILVAALAFLPWIVLFAVVFL